MNPLLVALLGGALAAPVPVATLPGRAITLGPCTADPAAPCWEEAALLDRFAVAPGALGVPLSADLRLAWAPGGLLVRIGALPESARAEVSVSPAAGDDRLRNVDAIVLTAPSDGPAVARLPLAAAPKAGEERLVRLNLVTGEGAGALARYWAPSGPGDHDHPILALWVAQLVPPLPVDVSVDGGKISVVAPGATSVEIEADAPARPRAAKGIPEPWSTRGKDRVSFAPFETGWHVATARWHHPGGEGFGIVERRFWVEGAPPPDLAWQDVHPAPAFRQLAGGAPFRLESGARICARRPEVEPAARLLAEELERFTGVRVVPGATGGCAIELAPPDPARLPPEALAHASRPEGFALVVDRKRAIVLAGDLRGAVYGALALADAIGPDGAVPALVAADSPEIALRVLYYSLNLRAVPDFEVETARLFLRRAAARGRYNLLVLTPNDSLKYRTHPEIAHGRALDRADLQRILAAARELGMEVAPGANVPSHAGWITASHPELKEDVEDGLLCTRHPATRPLLEDIYAELIEVFGDIRWFHLGHDEASWATDRLMGNERCPRCAATARWELWRDELEWNARWFSDRGIRPIVWTDMFLEDWNGSKDGLSRTPEVLSDLARRTLVMMAWSPLGDPIANLQAPRDGQPGFALLRTHTGYLDWKREKLAEQKDKLLGEGLALFTPTPWSATGPSPADRPLHYHTASVVLAGAPAWRPALAETSISSTFRAASGLPAYRPGYRRPAASSGRTRPVTVTGNPVGTDLPAFAWPARLRSGEVDFGAPVAREARAGAPVALGVGGRAAGVSLLLATVVTHDAEQRLLSDRRRPRAPDNAPAAELVATWADGRQEARALDHGIDVYAPDAGPRSLAFWQAAGVAAVASESAIPAATDLTLFRVDWENPRPDAELARLEVRTDRPGVVVVVGGAVALEAGGGAR